MRRNLNKEDRKMIEYGIKLGWKNVRISKIIKRDASTISKEIKKNGGREAYRYGRAMNRYKEKRKTAKILRLKIENSEYLRKYIEKNLKKYLSPEQISGKLKRETKKILSHETIYKWIYKKRPKLQKYLRCQKGQWKRRRGSKKRAKQRRLQKFKCIETRPVEVETKERLGDWEGDTVIGKNKKHRLLTYVDRKSGYGKAVILHQVTADIVQKRTRDVFEKIPRKKRHTITYDRGKEFGEEDFILENYTKTAVYRAHAYSSWERGANENWNGLLRQFFPKGSCFNHITQKNLDRVVRLLNHRPRKRLNYLSPHQVFVLNRDTQA